MLFYLLFIMYEKIWYELNKLDDLNNIINIFIDFTKILELNNIECPDDFLEKIELFEISTDYLFEIKKYVYPIPLIIYLLENTKIRISENIYIDSCNFIVKPEKYYIQEFIHYYNDIDIDSNDINLLKKKYNQVYSLCEFLIDRYEKDNFL